MLPWAGVSMPGQRAIFLNTDTVFSEENVWNKKHLIWSTAGILLFDTLPWKPFSCCSCYI